MLYARRPRSVTYAAMGGFLLGGWNLWRALLLFRRRPLLLDLEVSVDPLVRALLSLLWAIVFTAAALAILQRRSRARWWLPAALFLYLWVQFGLTWLFSKSQLAWQGWRASLLAYTVALLAAIWALYRPATRPYWRRPVFRARPIDHERGEVVT
jgi:hypothetical protein